MRVVSVEATDLAVAGDDTFVIRESEPGENAFAWVPSDIAVCTACLDEMHEPSDRRHEYPFTNCTNCGPRYSIILDVPYDPVQTTIPCSTECLSQLRTSSVAERIAAARTRQCFGRELPLKR